MLSLFQGHLLSVGTHTELLFVHAERRDEDRDSGDHNQHHASIFSHISFTHGDKA